MACLNMFNNEQQQQQQGQYFPRISFSSDFADAQHQLIKHEASYREPPVSSDFEFSASGFGMISHADEVIVKGKLLPLKEHCTSKMTLRDELLAGDEYEDVMPMPRLPKGSGRWKERLGLKRPHIVPKKADKNVDLFAYKFGPKPN